MAVAENVNEPLERLARFGKSAAMKSRGERAMLSAGHEDEAVGEFFKLAFFDGAAAFRCAHLHSRGETADVLITTTGFSQERITAAVGGCQLRANVRMKARLFRCVMKLRSAINTIPIEQSHGGHSQLRADVREFFGQGSPVEKTECGCGMEFNVGGHGK